MEDRDERDDDNTTEESVEIPINVDEEDDETLGPDESTEVRTASDGSETEVGEANGAVGDADTDPETESEEIDDLYVSPEESDVEVVDDGGGDEAGNPDSRDDAERGRATTDREADETGAPEGADPVEEEPSVEETVVETDGPSREELKQRIASLESTVESLEEERDQIADERDDFEERMLRAAADLENFRKRAEREKEELEKYGAKQLVKDLLQTIDNLERALEHADSSDEGNIIEGVEMVLRQIHTTLNKHGIEQFDSEGEEFDPEKHEAIQQVETSDHESGEIIDEFQKGYFIHDRLLRPAMVSVAERVEPEEGASEEPEEVEGEASAEASETADQVEETERDEDEATEAGTDDSADEESD